MRPRPHGCCRVTDPTRSFEVLELLQRHRVDFIVVGMTAAVLQGAPVVTFDLDVVYARTPGNIAHLLAALTEVEAVFRTDPERRIAPNESHLMSVGHKLLMTRLGQLDVLGELAEGEDYAALLPDSVIVDVEGMPIRTLSLERLILAKERANREKDRAVLPLLRSTLARGRRK
jgi:hypothetical protein